MKRDQRIELRTTTEEKKRIKKVAKQLKLSLTKTIVHCTDKQYEEFWGSKGLDGYDIVQERKY